MPYADLNGERIDCLFNWNEKDRLLLLPGARYRRDAHGRDIVSLPLSWGSCLALRGMFGPELRLSQTLGEWATQHRAKTVTPGLGLRSATGYADMDAWTDYDPEPAWSGSGLRPFQAAGVEWMYTVGSGVLGDEMGSGKTVQSLTFIDRKDDALPALVIAPNSVKRHWSNLAPRWAPRAVPYVVDGTAAARRKVLKAAAVDPNALVIINIESVRSFSRLAPYGSIRLKRCQECDPKSGDAIKSSQCEIHEKELNSIAFRSVFLDEAHQIGNPESKQTRAVWHVMQQTGVTYRWGLSGTVQSDHFGNLWSVLHGILPDDFPVKSKAVDRYCLTRANPIGAPEIIGLNPATKAELYGILDPHFRRMLKSVTSPQLPPVLRETRTAVLAAKHQKIYNDVESSLFGDLGNGELIITHSNLTKADRLQQIAAAAVEIEKPDEDDISTWKIRMKDPSPKADVLMEVLEDGGYLTGSGPGVAVAAVHKDLIRLVSDRLSAAEVRHGILTGDQSTAERDLALTRFQQGDDRVLLFTVAAGSVGLDMTAADLLVNLQRPWSMVKAVQTEGRVHRIGSEVHSVVRIVDILTEGTLEEQQVERLTQKLMRLEEINRDTANVPQHEQDPDLQHEAQLILNSDVMEIPSDPYAGVTEDPVPEQQEYTSPFLETGHEGEHHEAQSAPVTFDEAMTVLVETGTNYPAVVETLKEQLPAAVPTGEIEVPGPFEQPERMDCPCCEKNTKVNADGTIRYHFSDKPECRIGPDSRRCRAVGEPWTWRPDGGAASEESADAPLPAAQTVRGYVCRIPAGPDGCGKVVELTANKRARSHLDPQGARCGGGSDWPILITERGERIDTKPGCACRKDDEGPHAVTCPSRHINPQPGDHPARPVEDVQLRDLTPEEKEIAVDPDAWAVVVPQENGFLINSTPSATVGLEVRDGVVVDGPPYAQKWAVGRTKEEIEAGSGETTWLPDGHCAQGRCTGCCGCSSECTDNPCGMGAFNDPAPDAVALAEDMRTEEETKVDQQELADALKAECDKQIADLAEQNGAWTPPEFPPVTPRVLITGSRKWATESDAQGQPTPATVREWELLREKIECVYREYPESVLVSGACPTGADFLAEHVWSSFGGAIERHPAEWDEYGKNAGFRRNQEMVDLGADLCIGFIKNGSAGATHTVDAAARAGIPTLVIKEDGDMYVFNMPDPAPETEMPPIAGTHAYTDSTGVQWTHPGDRSLCHLPECQEVTALVVHSEPFVPPGPAADVLRAEGTLPDQVVSATKMNDWQQCKRKWWLRWYRNLEATPDLTDVRNTGIRVHEALAAWYVPEGTERHDPRDVLREAIGRDWNRTLERMQLTPESEGFEAVSKKWESVAVLERAMIEGYMEWMEETGADAGYTVIGSELEVAVNMTDPDTGMTVQARGVMDAKIRRDVDGVRLFIDHKSVGDFDRATKFLKMRNQMLHYHLIEWLSTPEGEARCDGALYNMLRRVKRTAKAKPPFFQRKTSDHNEIQLRAYRARLLGEARSMARAERMLEAGVPHHMAVPASPSDDCSWKCEFAAVCPMFDDGSRAEDMVKAVYHQGDPWQRYDLLGPGTTVEQ